jgi:hypothetical protein
MAATLTRIFALRFPRVTLNGVATLQAALQAQKTGSDYSLGRSESGGIIKSVDVFQVSSAHIIALFK